MPRWVHRQWIPAIGSIRLRQCSHIIPIPRLWYIIDRGGSCPKNGEKIIFKVDKKLAAYGEVIGESYYDRSKVWDKALYPYRIKISIDHILSTEDRLPLLGDIRKKNLGRFLLNRKIKKKKISTLFFKFNIPPLTKFGS